MPDSAYMCGIPYDSGDLDYDVGGSAENYCDASGSGNSTTKKTGDKTCNRCGATGLHWVETDQGWRLYDGDEIHRCNRSEVKVNMKPLTQAGFLAMRDRAEKAEAEVERLKKEKENYRQSIFMIQQGTIKPEQVRL